MRSLHATLLIFALNAGVAASVCFAMLVGEASASRLDPLDGTWHAEFLADSGREDREPTSRQRSVRGTLRLRPPTFSGPSWNARLWVTVFKGSNPLQFQAMTGEDGADGGYLSAERFGRDSVGLRFGDCDDCGAIFGRARIVADTIAGSWRTSSWGEGTSGLFRLIRVGRPATERRVRPIVPVDADATALGAHSPSGAVADARVTALLPAPK